MYVLRTYLTSELVLVAVKVPSPLLAKTRHGLTGRTWIESGSRPGYYLTSWFMDGVLRGPVRYGTPVLAVHTVPYGVPRYDTIKLILRGNYPTSEGDHRVHMQTSSEVHHHPSWAPIGTLSD
jgi:hypothetical protein